MPSDAELSADVDATKRSTCLTLKPIVEALIFASPEPITPKTLVQAARHRAEGGRAGGARGAEARTTSGRAGCSSSRSPAAIRSSRAPELHEWVRRLFHERTTQKLSVQALETLAVIAYKQPVTAPEIAEIRGVNTAAACSARCSNGT